MNCPLNDLPTKYPLVFRAYENHRRYRNSPIAYYGFECEAGWYRLIDEFAAWFEGEATQLKDAGKRVPIITQCKEKLGALVIHVRHFPRARAEELFGYLDRAALTSLQTCEVCGQPGELRKAGLLQTRCEQHWSILS